MMASEAAGTSSASQALTSRPIVRSSTTSDVVEVESNASACSESSPSVTMFLEDYYATDGNSQPASSSKCGGPSDTKPKRGCKRTVVGIGKSTTGVTPGRYHKFFVQQRAKQRMAGKYTDAVGRDGALFWTVQYRFQLHVLQSYTLLCIPFLRRDRWQIDDCAHAYGPMLILMLSRLAGLPVLMTAILTEVMVGARDGPGCELSARMYSAGTVPITLRDSAKHFYLERLWWARRGVPLTSWTICSDLNGNKCTINAYMPSSLAPVCSGPASIEYVVVSARASLQHMLVPSKMYHRERSNDGKPADVTQGSRTVLDSTWILHLCSRDNRCSEPEPGVVQGPKKISNKIQKDMPRPSNLSVQTISIQRVPQHYPQFRMVQFYMTVDVPGHYDSARSNPGAYEIRCAMPENMLGILFVKAWCTHRSYSRRFWTST